jgi:hypothetical protein
MGLGRKPFSDCHDNFWVAAGRRHRSRERRRPGRRILRYGRNDRFRGGSLARAEVRRVSNSAVPLAGRPRPMSEAFHQVIIPCE